MTITTLRALCDLISEQVSPRSDSDSLYIGLEHIQSARFHRIGGGRESEVESGKFAFRRGDVLYGKLRPYLDKAIVADADGICTTELLVLRPKKGVSAEFLVGVLHSPSFIEHAMSGVTGVQHPRTSWQRIAEFELPNLGGPERDQVASLLWLAHDAITLNESVEAELAVLKRAAMRELFTRGLRSETQKETEIGPIPESWDVDNLGNHFSVVSGGTPSRSVPEYWQDGTIPWVKTTEINYTPISEVEEYITEAGLRNSAAKMLPAGTLLIAMYGQGVTRGRVAFLQIDAACNQACAAMNPLDAALEPTYLFHWLSHRYDEIRNLAHGGQQQNLNLEIVRGLKVARPTDVVEQREIVAILDAINRKIALHKEKRAVLEALFKSLLHKLMTGEVRVADLHLDALGGAAEAA